MKDRRDSPFDELLRRAVDAVLDDPMSDEPSPDRVAQLAVAAREAASEPYTITFIERIKTMKLRTRIAVAAAVVIAFFAMLSWLVPTGGTAVYADAIEALRNARTFHLTLMVQAEKGTTTAYEAWYKRNEGYSMRFGADVRINDGKYAYAYSVGQPSAVRWAEDIGMNDNSPFIRQMQLPECGLPVERAAGADQRIHGVPCLAYEYQPGPKDQPLAPDRKQTARLMLWVDRSHRAHRAERQIRKGETWKPDLVWNIEYNVLVESSRFDPKAAFGSDVKILDADKAFDERFGLANALYKQDVGGLRYAVHEFKACADGTILVVSSLRRDEQTEKEFPPEYRKIRPGMMIAEVGRQQFDYNCQIELASAVHGPVLVQWWLLVPLPVDGPHGPIKPEPGTVMFRASFIYHDIRLWNKYQPGAKVKEAVQLLVVLDTPSRKNPLQGPELAAHVYSGVASLQRFALTQLVTGVEKNTQLSKDPDEMTPQEYAEHLAAYLNMREHESNNQLLRELERLKELESHQHPKPGERTNEPRRVRPDAL